MDPCVAMSVRTASARFSMEVLVEKPGEHEEAEAVPLRADERGARWCVWNPGVPREGQGTSRRRRPADRRADERAHGRGAAIPGALA